MPGGLTPICNSCGVALCWDISAVDYLRDGRFWDAWRCEDCNGGQPFTRKAHAAAAPPELDAMARKVLSYKPKPKSKPAKARQKKAKRARLLQRD